MILPTSHTDWMIVGGVLAGLFLIYVLQDRDSEKRVRRRFKVGTEYALIAHDLGNGKKGKSVIHDGMIGKPDAAFAHHDRRHLIVGELKSRAYRNRVKLYERYQVVLYGGMLLAKYPGYQIELRLAFRDKVVKVPFDYRLYQRLLGLVPEYKASMQRGAPVNTTPLHKR